MVTNSALVDAWACIRGLHMLRPPDCVADALSNGLRTVWLSVGVALLVSASGARLGQASLWSAARCDVTLSFRRFVAERLSSVCEHRACPALVHDKRRRVSASSLDLAIQTEARSEDAGERTVAGLSSRFASAKSPRAAETIADSGG